MKSMASYDRYICPQRGFEGLRGPQDPVWGASIPIHFVRAEDGRKPALSTRAKMFYNVHGQAPYVGFWGEDDFVLSEYTKRDQPIFHQDVFELFVSDGGNLHRYKELQVSPFNVQVGADITHHSPGHIDVHVGWDFAGWQSATHFDRARGLLYSAWRLDFSGFAVRPAPGLCWRANLLRCDHSARGLELSAWRCTGAPEFHLPERFGHLEFG